MAFPGDLVLARLSHADRIGLNADLSQAIAAGAIGDWLPLGVPGLDVSVTTGLRPPAGSPLAWFGSQIRQWTDLAVGLILLQWAIDVRWFLSSTVDIGSFGVDRSCLAMAMPGSATDGRPRFQA